MIELHMFASFRPEPLTECLFSKLFCLLLFDAKLCRTLYIQAYNLYVSLICLILVTKSIFGEFPSSLIIFVPPLLILTLASVEGILIVISVVRLLFVLDYMWISMQEYKVLGQRILMVVFLVSASMASLTAYLTIQFEPDFCSATPLLISTFKQRIDILLTSVFLAANLCVLTSYLTCSLILNRRRAASLSILIGERSHVKSKHLLRMRTMLVGNTLALLTAGTLLAITILPTPFQQRRLRPVELQMHVFIMLYYAGQVKLGAFVRRKVAQKLEPYWIQLERKRRRIAPRRIAPLPVSSANVESLEMGQISRGPLNIRPGNSDLAVVNNDGPSNINNQATFIENYDIPAATSLETTVATIHETPVTASSETPVGASHVSNSHETPIATRHETHIATFYETHIANRHETPVSNSPETPVDTSHKTPIATSSETPVNTSHEAPIATRHETIHEIPDPHTHNIEARITSHEAPIATRHETIHEVPVPHTHNIEARITNGQAVSDSTSQGPQIANRDGIPVASSHKAPVLNSLGVPVANGHGAPVSLNIENAYNIEPCPKDKNVALEASCVSPLSDALFPIDDSGQTNKSASDCNHAANQISKLDTDWSTADGQISKPGSHWSNTARQISKPAGAHWSITAGEIFKPDVDWSTAAGQISKPGTHWSTADPQIFNPNAYWSIAAGQVFTPDADSSSAVRRISKPSADWRQFIRQTSTLAAGCSASDSPAADRPRATAHSRISGVKNRLEPKIKNEPDPLMSCKQVMTHLNEELSSENNRITQIKSQDEGHLHTVNYDPKKNTISREKELIKSVVVPHLSKLPDLEPIGGYLEPLASTTVSSRRKDKRRVAWTAEPTLVDPARARQVNWWPREHKKTAVVILERENDDDDEVNDFSVRCERIFPRTEAENYLNKWDILPGVPT